MKTQSRFKVITTGLVFMAISIMTAGSAWAYIWPTPVNGWQHEYVASADNGIPDQYDANWTRTSYQTNTPGADLYTGIVSDGSEGDVLQMTHLVGSAAVYRMTASPGDGTTNDLITLDFRYRITDDSKTDAQQQLFFSIERPRPDGLSGRCVWLVAFKKEGIAYLQPGGTYASYNTALSTNWHDVRLVVNVKNGDGKIYLDHAPKPVVTGFVPYIDTYVRKAIAFGDGATAVSGKANLKHIRWTNSELAVPLVHEGAEDPETECWTKYVGGTGLAWESGSEAGTPYWQGTDSGAGASGDYRYDLPAGAVADPNGWTATAKVRAVSASTRAYAVCYVIYDGVSRWNMIFMPDELYYNNASGLYPLVTADLAAGEYHTYQCYFNPAGDGGNGTLSYYCNGVLKLEITRTQAVSDTTIPRLRWGSANGTATSVQRWNYVEFAGGNQVIDPPPPTGTVIMLK